MKKKNKAVNRPVFFDTPEEVLNTYNCVYKLTTVDGHYKIGYTTQPLRARINEYFGESRKEDIVQITKKHKGIKAEILATADDIDILIVLEQLFIFNELKQILCANGLHRFVEKYMSTHVSYNPFNFECVQKSLLLNKVFDEKNHLIDYFNGVYDDYFKVFPFEHEIGKAAVTHTSH